MLPIPVVLCNNCGTVHPKFTPKELIDGEKTKQYLNIFSNQREKGSLEYSIDMDKKTFSPFIVNRWLSMNLNLIELVNELQKHIGQLKPRDVYKLYFDVLPQKKNGIVHKR